MDAMTDKEAEAAAEVVSVIELAKKIGDFLDGTPGHTAMMALAVLVAYGISRRDDNATIDECIDGHVEMVRTFLKEGGDAPDQRG